MTQARSQTDIGKPQKNKTRQYILRGISVIVTVALMAYLLSNLDWKDFNAIASRVSLAAMAGSLLAYFVLNVFRAIRFRSLLDKADAPLKLLIPITLYHNFLVRILPFKLGELSYIVLLRTRLNYSMQEGVSSLIGARILELLIIIMVFASSILLSADHFQAQRNGLLLIILIVFIGSVLGLYFAGTVIRVGINIVNAILMRLIKRPIAFIKKLEVKLLEIADEFDRIRNPRLFLSALFISIFTYASSFLTNYILLVAIGLNADIPTVVTIISVGMFASAFPFSISGFGVVELSWYFGLTQFAGYTDSEATSIGFLLHGFQVISATILGFIGYLFIQLIPPMEASSFTATDTIKQADAQS